MNNQLDLDVFGCEFCAGTGYEDYPSCKKPCRVAGHKERHETNVKIVLQGLERRKKFISAHEEGR